MADLIEAEGLDEEAKKKTKKDLSAVTWRREHDKKTGKVKVVWDVPKDI